MIFINVLGYLIKMDSITCVSDLQTIKTFKDKNDKEGIDMYEFSVFFDGNRVSWRFETKEEAEKVRNFILEKIGAVE